MLRLACAWLACVSLAFALATGELTGACYCRAGGEVRWCVVNITERACRERCASELCDDWFWIELRACWNWGYGG